MKYCSITFRFGYLVSVGPRGPFQMVGISFSSSLALSGFGNRHFQWWDILGMGAFLLRNLLWWIWVVRQRLFRVFVPVSGIRLCTWLDRSESFDEREFSLNLCSLIRANSNLAVASERSGAISYALETRSARARPHIGAQQFGRTHK